MDSLQRLPNYYAFFDVDGTLINIKSTHSFLKFYNQDRFKIKAIGLLRYYYYLLKIKIYEKLKINRRYLNIIYYKNFQGANSNYIKELSSKWYEATSKEKNIFLEESLRELRQHQIKGAEVVLVSGSFEECLMPLAKALNINYILATKMKSIDGILTGDIATEPMIGKGKADAINNFLKEKNFSFLDRCYAYGDHISDYQMLALIGNSGVVKGDKILMSHAKNNGWQLLSKKVCNK